MGRAQQQQSAGSHWRFSFLYCWSWALAIHTQMACQLKTCRATLLWVHNFNQDCFFFPSLEMHAFCMSQLLGCGCIFNTSKSRNEHENEDSRSISSCAIFLTRAAWWSSISLLSLSHTHTQINTHTHTYECKTHSEWLEPAVCHQPVYLRTGRKALSGKENPGIPAEKKCIKAPDLRL